MGLFFSAFHSSHKVASTSFRVFHDLKFSRMRYVAAYLLAVLGGNESPKEADLKKILSSVGVDADADSLKKVISELSGKSIDVIAAGKEKLASVPSGGGAVAAAGGAAAGGDAPAEEKKEEKKEESEEEEDDDMGFGLFD